MKKTYGYFHHPNEFSREYLLYPLEMGYIVNLKEFLINRAFYPGYLLMCCISGKLHLEQFGNTGLVCPGESCLMTLERPHVYYSDQSDPCEILWINFAGNTASRLLPSILENAGSYVITQNSLLPVLVRNCIATYENDTLHSDFEMSSILYEILMKILKSATAGTGAEYAFSSTLTQTLDPFLANRLGEKITLEQMAEQCHLNPSYFCRRFRAETGITPMQYLLRKRIEMAKYLLTYTEDSLLAVAAQLGFYDQNHFSVSFTKAVGCSPSKFRKQKRG